VELAESGAGFTEAIVFDEEKAGLPVPASFLFDAEHQLQGALNAHDSQAHERIRGMIKPVASRPRPYTERGVAFLPLSSRCRLVIVGGGHIGKAVAGLAADLDFEVWVTDDRESCISKERFPRADRRLAGPCQQVLQDLEITPDTYCLIVTRGHNHDQEALYRLVNRGARYVGMIGSRRKIGKIFADLADAGVPVEALEEVYAPVGIDIGSQTVTEIAVSIVAELIAHRNRSGQIPGRPERVLVDLP
jgi:xanthine dehydrogenase accessory factor